MNCPYPVRVCTKCKRILIANEINFRRNSKSNNKFRASCIICEKEYYKNHKDDIKAKRKERYKNNSNCKFREISDTFILPDKKWIIVNEGLVKMLMKNKPNNKLYSSEIIRKALIKEKNNE